MKRHKLAWLNLCQPARNDAATIDRAYRSSGSRSFERIVRNPSAYREKVRRKVNVGLHRDEMIRAARGRPNLVRDRFCAQPRPLIEAPAYGQMCMNRLTVPVIECMAPSSGDSFARPGTHLRHSSMVGGTPSGLKT